MADKITGDSSQGRTDTSYPDLTGRPTPRGWAVSRQTTAKERKNAESSTRCRSHRILSLIRLGWCRVVVSPVARRRRRSFFAAYRKGISVNRKLLPMLVCGLLVHTALCGCSPQDKAVGWERVPAEIRTLGGIAWADEKSPGRPVTVSFMAATGAFDAGLRHLREIRQLNHLDLSHTLVSDHGQGTLSSSTEQGR